MTPPPLVEWLTEDHRRLDRLFGELLAAIAARDLAGALPASEAFDEALRSHTRKEEEEIFPPVSEDGLVPPAEESPSRRLFRGLRLEHLQVRELSGMIRRLLAGESAVDGARGLAANLARRWDAHSTREEREAFPLLSGV